MTSKHYDVLVLGAGVGALAAAALLARRSWRVLVVGQGFRRATYAYDRLRLARRPFTFLSASSPAWGRVLVELAQSQTFRRRLSALDPMLQVLGPDLRLDVPPDTELFGREVDREFVGARRVIEDLYAELARTNELVDAAFERDAVWPPGGFWERRETARVVATLPHLEPTADILAELPRDHGFRRVVATPAEFATDLAGSLPTFALARLHGAWTRGVQTLNGGEDELVDFLLERIRAHGGDTRLADRVTTLVHKGGRVRGAEIDGDESLVGVTFVVSDLPSAEVLDLARGFVAPRGPREGGVDTPEARFVTSVVVRAEGVPDRLAAESFILPARGRALHVQRTALGEGLVRLTAEAIVPSGEPVGRMREAVLEGLLECLPFLDRHLVVCDCVHDGLPLWDFRDAGERDPIVVPAADGPRRSVLGPLRGLGALQARLVPRASVRAGGGSVEAEPMAARFRPWEPQLAGLAGEPIRTALGNVFVTGKSTLPALGQEGELLAAWGVARIITKTDRRKEKMLREMWSKVELS